MSNCTSTRQLTEANSRRLRNARVNTGKKRKNKLGLKYGLQSTKVDMVCFLPISGFDL